MLTPVWRDFLALASLSSLSEEYKSSTKDLKDSGRASISSPSSVSNQAKSKCGDGALHDVYVYCLKSMEGNICQNVAPSPDKKGLAHPYTKKVEEKRGFFLPKWTFSPTVDPLTQLSYFNLILRFLEI